MVTIKSHIRRTKKGTTRVKAHKREVKFPKSPYVGQTMKRENVVYEWDGHLWVDFDVPPLTRIYHQTKKNNKMSLNEAENILGDRPRWELLKMKKALSMFPILNSDEENERLVAVKVMLKKGN